MAEDNTSPFHNPFAALKHLRGDAPEAGSKDPASDKLNEASEARIASVTPTGRVIPRAVVRLERTGRGGKEVTVVEQLNLNAAEREQWLKALKSGLGCGGSIEGESLMIQGDQRKRIPALLTARGVKKVIIS